MNLKFWGFVGCLVALSFALMGSQILPQRPVLLQGTLNSGINAQIHSCPPHGRFDSESGGGTFPGCFELNAPGPYSDYPVQVPGTLMFFRIQLEPAINGTATQQLLQKNGTTLAGRDLLCTIPPGGTTCSDLVTRMAVQSGDVIRVVTNWGGGIFPTGGSSWSIVFVPSN
jgi:hypothetical protein